VLAVPLRIELVAVDDASTDGTRELLQQLGRERGFKVLLQEKNRGKGAAGECRRAITGIGTLGESTDDVANREEGNTRGTGRMVAGVLEGKVKFCSSVIEPLTETVEMVGGCEVANTLCHPRQPRSN